MNTVKLRYLKLDGTVLKLQGIPVFEISRVKYLRNKWLGLTNKFDISIVCEISGFNISKFN